MMNAVEETEFSEDGHSANLGETLKEYLGIVRRRIWLILIITATTTGLATWWSMNQIPLYQSASGIVVEDEASKIMEISSENAQRLNSGALQTHLKLITSFPVLQEAVARLNISEAPEYKNFSGSSDPGLIGAFSGNVKTGVYKKSNLVQIKVISENPEFAAQAANALANVYIDHISDLHGQTKQTAAQWFETHIDDLRQKLSESEQALYDYAAEIGVTNLPEQQQLIDEKLNQLNSELNQTEMKRLELQARVEQLQKEITAQKKENGNIASTSALVQSPIIEKLEAEQVELSRQVSLLSERYGPLHPKMITAQTELTNLRNHLRQEVLQSTATLQNSYNRVLAKERLLRKKAKTLTAQKVKLDQVAMRYGILDREAASNRGLFDLYLKQMGEADISTKIKTSNIFLAESALPSGKPFKPNNPKNIAIGFLLGLMSSLGFAFAAEMLNQKLKGPKDFDRQLPGIPCLGVIPLIPKKKKLQVNRKAGDGYLAFLEDRYAYIRTSVLLAFPPNEPISLMITSPGGQEGKTTLAANLARSLAQLNAHKVVIIDGDLRRPSVHHLIQIQNGKSDQKGLTDYLMGNATIEEVLHATNLPNLRVIPAGSAVSNPADLLHSTRLNSLSQWCREAGYHVIFDSPPALAIPDAFVLANQAAKTLVAISSGETSSEAARLTLQQLRNHQVDLIGIVMQKTPLDRTPYQYRNSPYYVLATGKSSQLLPVDKS